MALAEQLCKFCPLFEVSNCIRIKYDRSSAVPPNRNAKANRLTLAC